MSDSATGGPRGSRQRFVLVADTSDFGGLLRDDMRSIAAHTRIRDAFTTVVPRHGGTLDVRVGESFVAVFEGAVEAVRAAIAIQTDLAGAGPAGDPVRIRIGVHVGDAGLPGSGIVGESVNVAARLQLIARPGGIAVSEAVYHAVRDRFSGQFRDLGPRSVKDSREKMRIYELHVEEGAVAPSAQARSLRSVILAVIGTVLVAGLAALAHRVANQKPEILGVPAATTVREVHAPAGAPLMVGVTGVSTQGDVPAWMQDNTRDGLNTLLSKVARLRVFSREKIDFLRQRRGLSEIEVAETLGIQKMISGSIAMDSGDVVLEARVVDISTGILDASERARGRPDELIELQNQLATSVLAAIGVTLSSDEQVQLFAQRTKETLDGYRRLSDTFGEAPARPDAAGPGTEKTSWLSWPRAAWADAPEAAPAIVALVEAYRAALERKDIGAVAATHVELTAEQRAGFERYFESANALTVTVSDLDVLQEGDEALVTFTRRDAFRDKDSGKEIELEVRLSSEVVRKDGRWLLRGVKRS